MTGGKGFLGKVVVKKLREAGCKDIFVFDSKQYNLIQVELLEGYLTCQWERQQAWGGNRNWYSRS